MKKYRTIVHKNSFEITEDGKTYVEYKFNNKSKGISPLLLRQSIFATEILNAREMSKNDRTNSKCNE